MAGATYTVQGGDNLVSIAQRYYNNPRMFAEIMRLNNLQSGTIRPGMVLKLPANKPNEQIVINSKDLVGMEQERQQMLSSSGLGDKFKLGFQNAFTQLGAQPPMAAGQPPAAAPGVGNVPGGITQNEINRAMGTGGLMQNYVPPAAGISGGVPNNWMQMPPEAAAAYGARDRGYISRISSGTEDSFFGPRFNKPIYSGGATGQGEMMVAGTANRWQFKDKTYDRYQYQPPAKTQGEALANKAANIVGSLPFTPQQFVGGTASVAGNLAQRFATGIPGALAQTAMDVSRWWNAPIQQQTQPTKQTGQQPTTQTAAPTNSEYSAVGSLTGITVEWKPPSIIVKSFDTDLPTVPAVKTATPILTAQDFAAVPKTQQQESLYQYFMAASSAYNEQNPAPTLTTEEANQIRYVFGIQSGSYFDQWLTKISPSGGTLPPTSNDLLNELSQNAINFNAYGAPALWPQQGGVGGGNKNNKNQNGGTGVNYGNVKPGGTWTVR